MEAQGHTRAVLVAPDFVLGAGQPCTVCVQCREADKTKKPKKEVAAATKEIRKTVAAATGNKLERGKQAAKM